MTQTDLEDYLVGLGHTSNWHATEELWKTAQRRGLDLESQPVSRLAVANDSLRMDIRNVADLVFRRLREK